MAAKQGPTMESLMECPICLGSFQDPRILACLHTFCKTCLEDHVSASGPSGKFKCPTCRHQCRVPKGGIASVPKSFFLNSLKDVLEQQQQQPDQPASSSEPASQAERGKRECYNSKRSKTPHSEATVYCEDCAKFYCESCESSHKIFEEFSEHHFIPASEVSPSTIQAAESKRRVPRCDQHPVMQLDIYCDTCHVLTCTTCCLLQHKQHEYRELAAVSKESQDKLAELVQAAAELIDKLGKHLQELKASEDNIQRDFNKVCQDVHQAADAMRDLVTKREQYLIQQIQDSEKVALLEVKASHKNTELSKVSAQSLHSYMAALLKSGDVTDQIIHTPGLQEQLHQQEAIPLRSATWTASFKEEAQSVAALDAMLGTVNVDQTATTPLAAGGDEDFVLDAPVLTLRPDVDNEVSGIAVVGDCVCVTGWGKPYLWIHNMATHTNIQHTIDHDLQAWGMTVHNNTLIITDYNNNKLHFITITPHNMSISNHTVKDLPFKPCHVSLDEATGKLIIANGSDKQIVVCDSTGNIERRIPVNPDVGAMLCAIATHGGYAVLDSSSPGRVHWVDMHGDVTHTYGQQDGEGLRYPRHMVQDTQGRLVVADTYNHRLHLIGANRQLSHFLMDDGIQYPACVCLDETTGRLFVGCRFNGQYELRVYKWPTTAPPTASTESTHHTLCVQLGRYK